LGLKERNFLLATIHRAENSDDKNRLGNILAALDAVEETVAFPVHPRTRNAMETLGYTPPANVRLIDPVGYLDMVRLEHSARMILTDSGGIQKEAYWLGVPCITFRDETEWVETVKSGWNIIVGADKEKIVYHVRNFSLPSSRPLLYGDGKATSRIVNIISEQWDPIQ
jgi:UDP-N-acetylglucosamine 2-epimerase